MAIGTAAAILGSAVIGGIGSAISSGNSNKAISQATAAQQQSTTESNALVRDIYNQNKGVLSPFVTRGNAAGAAMNALLGLGGAEMSGPGAAQAYFPEAAANDPRYATYGTPGYGGPVAAVGRSVGQEYPFLDDPVQGDSGYLPPTQPSAFAGTPTTAGGTSAYQAAFDNFRNSTGYQFRMGEGMKSLNTGYAARGLLNSGAAQKAALNYGQNIASGEFGNYMGYLGNQQGVGLSAGNALAGVGTNYANSITSNNQNMADSLSNAALLKSQNNNALISGMTGMAGNALGYFSSYGRR